MRRTARENLEGEGDRPSLSKKAQRSQEPAPIKIRRAAMDSLARREHSYAELARKLLTKFADNPDVDRESIDEQLSRLRDQGLQSDTRFAEAYVRYRKTRGFSYLHIRADLLGRGVSEALIEAYLFEDDEDWLAMAESLVEKRLRSDDDRRFGGKAHLKLTRFLESRGFTQATIRRVLDAKFLR